MHPDADYTHRHRSSQPCESFSRTAHSKAQTIRATCLGGALLIRDPQTSQVVCGDSNGIATINVIVPPSARGRTIRIQAVAPFKCDISHTVTWTFE